MTGIEFIGLKNRYLQALPSSNRSERTIKKYDMVLRKFESFLISEKENMESEINTATIERWRIELFAQNCKSNTIISYFESLRVFFVWAIDKGYTTLNPVNKKDMPKRTEIEYNILSLDEIKKVLTESPSEINHKTALRNRAIVVLLIQVGLRNEELRTLTPACLDFENNTIRIKHGKGDKGRTVAFPLLARQLVKEYLESGCRPQNLTADDYLFGTDADKFGHSTEGQIWKPFSSTGLLGLVNRYTRLCCGHEVGVHALRHCSASLWDNMGISMRDIQQALGHASISTTERVYVSVLNKSKAASSINNAFERLAIV